MVFLMNCQSIYRDSSRRSRVSARPGRPFAGHRLTPARGGGFCFKWGYPSWMVFVREKPIYKWMMGNPIYGNLVYRSVPL